jgi:PAS domain S-box-containing protein
VRVDAQFDAGIAQRFCQVSKASTFLVIALGLAGFCGWVFHGTSLLVLGSIVCLTALTTMISRSLYRVERERGWVEEELKKSEEKFVKAFRGSPVALIITSAKDHRYLDVSESFEQWTGWSRDEVIGRTPFEIGIWVNPAERWEFVRQLAEGAIHNLEVRYRRKDGMEMVGLGWGQLIEIGNEQCVISVVADITERKRAEEALSGMTRKLVEAQEQERSRIGRELHDDVAQRLAMLAIALGQLKDKSNLPVEVRNGMQELEQMTSDIAKGIHVLSHKLHSSNMELLGLVSGMRGWCEEYGKQHKLEIGFKSADVPPLRQEISLCLYRVLQEALHNAAKHSGVKRIEVQLAVKSGEIHLIVCDSGKGFDIEAARQKRGLGLTSMQERVRLVGGTIVIESKPLAGTVVRVCVPFRAERGAGPD